MEEGEGVVLVVPLLVVEEGVVLPVVVVVDGVVLPVIFVIITIELNYLLIMWLLTGEGTVFNWRNQIIS